MPKKKSTEMVTFSILLAQEDMDKLQRLADEDHRPRAQMARLLLADAIKKTAEKKAAT